MCRQNTESDKTEVKHMDTEAESQDCPQSEYTTPLLWHKWPNKSICKMPQDYHQTQIIKYRDNEHIRPPLGSTVLRTLKIHQTDCEVDTGAGCNILPAHKAKELFGKEWLENLNPPKVQIEAYGGQSVSQPRIMYPSIYILKVKHFQLCLK